jgi:hypothetical protein
MAASTHVTGLCDLATTLFRMAWEGVQDPTRLDQSAHPAFGIAAWLALIETPSSQTTHLQRSMRLNFHEALEVVLAAAIVWARRLRATPSPVQTGRLLLPEIFDSARSQRFENRNF